jgi:hypothetical protein
MSLVRAFLEVLRVLEAEITGHFRVPLGLRLFLHGIKVGTVLTYIPLTLQVATLRQTLRRSKGQASRTDRKKSFGNSR